MRYAMKLKMTIIRVAFAVCISSLFLAHAQDGGTIPDVRPGVGVTADIFSKSCSPGVVDRSATYGIFVVLYANTLTSESPSKYAENLQDLLYGLYNKCNKVIDTNIIVIQFLEFSPYKDIPYNNTDSQEPKSLAVKRAFADAYRALREKHPELNLTYLPSYFAYNLKDPKNSDAFVHSLSLAFKDFYSQLSDGEKKQFKEYMSKELNSLD